MLDTQETYLTLDELQDLAQITPNAITAIIGSEWESNIEYAKKIVASALHPILNLYYRNVFHYGIEIDSTADLSPYFSRYNVAGSEINIEWHGRGISIKTP